MVILSVLHYSFYLLKIDLLILVKFLFLFKFLIILNSVFKLFVLTFCFSSTK